MVDSNLQPGKGVAAAPAAPKHPHHGHELGATEDQVNMRATVPQRLDKKGSKVEEIAGNGEVDAQGG